VTRAAAIRARTAAINELKALVVTADETLRHELRGPRTERLVERCSRFRDVSGRDVNRRCTRASMRALARRIEHLDDEIADHDRVLKQLLDQAAPQLMAERGIGYATAAVFYLAWSHPGRCRSEAAYARLSGTAPIDATSGKTQNRHRLNRGGDRQLNRALYLVAITRRRCCPATKTYIARRISEGNTEREAIRCLKRYIARHVWRLLEHPPISVAPIHGHAAAT
jgi:transposase